MQINFIWKITILKYITFRDQIKIAEVYDTELTFSLTDTSKNIYVCNDSHRTSAEHRQKSSDSKRARKSPNNWVRQKIKKKKRQRKKLGWDLHLWEGDVKEEKVSTHWEVPSPVGTESALEPWRRAQQQVC